MNQALLPIAAAILAVSGWTTSVQAAKIKESIEGSGFYQPAPNSELQPDVAKITFVFELVGSEYTISDGTFEDSFTKASGFSGTQPYDSFGFSLLNDDGAVLSVFGNYNDDGGSYKFTGGDGALAFGQFSRETLSAVPLPASAPMFGAALLALAIVGYGVKQRKAATA